MVNAYQLINEYKEWNTKTNVPPAGGSLFSQISTKKSNTDRNNENWHKNATCRECGKKGQIRPNQTSIDINKDDNYESNYKDNKKSCENPIK